MQQIADNTHLRETGDENLQKAAAAFMLNPQVLEEIYKYVDQLVDHVSSGGSMAPFQADLNALFSAAFPLTTPAPAHSQAVMTEVTAYYRQVANLPYPVGYSVSPFWDRKQRGLAEVALALHDPRHVVILAQIGRVSGFDHRIFGDLESTNNVVSDKLSIIHKDFGVYVPQNYNIEESEFSIDSSLVKFGGKSYSNIFLTHLQYYLRTAHLAPQGQTAQILEIGGGYGGLARIFKLGLENVRYCIVDLPGSIIYSYVFLRLNFPDSNIVLATSNARLSGEVIKSADFILSPVNTAACMEGQTFDLAINTGSMQEMNSDAVDYFMNYIESITYCTHFYSFNYFPSIKECYTETSGMQSEEQVNLICPKIGPQWDALYTRMNTPGLVMDCSSRNWLEIILQRTDPAADHSARAKAHYEASLGLPLMSDTWLHHALMAAFSDPTEDHVRNLLNGIELFFFADLDKPNYMFYPDAPNHKVRYYSPAWPKLPIYTQPMEINTELRRAMFELLGEVRYFRTLCQTRSALAKLSTDAGGHR